ncbi:heme ABC transporter ATP-binding protein [Halovenus rubra]|uniref:Cobalamin import ATP-binding protein BtuD n=2 Tax=Halovenus rubra TaxID=869890 RepID=A0ABD5X728_9EURY|nr:heme ABC transporter ATP-binding protein [Halovenus rubra]
MIRVDGVELAYGDVQVLNGINMQIEPGELVAIVGPNGAGKTTLLRTINGILKPDRGEVLLDTKRIRDTGSKEVSRKLATVPQDTHIGFSFCAEDVVEMGRTPHRSRLDWSDDGDPVTEALERTETTHLRERNVDDLSGGERQRILLARALAQEPKALLLDEPTASLDINHQVRVLSLVEELVKEGRAALAAIHDLDLAARYCDRLFLLHNGSIAARGTPESVLRDPMLAAAFETETAVTQNPVTGTPTVAAVTGRDDRSKHVHIAGGGEGAAVAVRSLWQDGYDVTVGPAPNGDVVTDLARELDIKTVTAPAFSKPDETTRRAAIDTAREADAVVITEGPGSKLVAGAVETTKTVETNLGSAGTEVARVDGGNTTAVRTEAALIKRVSTVVDV